MAELTSEYASWELKGDVLVVTIKVSKLQDVEVAYSLRDQLKALVDAHPQATSMVLDLSVVDFVASVGFLGFLSLRRHWPGGRIILCGLSERVCGMFQLCRLIPSEHVPTAPFELAADLPSALAKC